MMRIKRAIFIFLICTPIAKKVEVLLNENFSE